MRIYNIYFITKPHKMQYPQDSILTDFGIFVSLAKSCKNIFPLLAVIEHSLRLASPESGFFG